MHIAKNCELQLFTLFNGSFGSWSCENVLAMRAGLRERAHEAETELESTLPLAPAAVGDLVEAGSMHTPMPTPYVWIAAMSGFTPTMFMTRVRL